MTIVMSELQNKVVRYNTSSGGFDEKARPISHLILSIALPLMNCSKESVRKPEKLASKTIQNTGAAKISEQLASSE